MNHIFLWIVIFITIETSESQTIVKNPTKRDIICYHKLDYVPTTEFQLDSRIRNSSNFFTRLNPEKLRSNEKFTNYMLNGEQVDGKIIYNSTPWNTVEYFNKHFESEIVRVEAIFPVVGTKIQAVCMFRAICALINKNQGKFTNFHCCIYELFDCLDLSRVLELYVSKYLVDANTSQNITQFSNVQLGIFKYFEKSLMEKENKYCENYIDIVMYSVAEDRKNLWWISFIPVVFLISFLLIGYLFKKL